MGTALKTLTDISIDGLAVENSGYFFCTVNGSASWAMFDYYDSRTGEKISSSGVPYNNRYDGWSNGKRVAVPYYFQNGKDVSALPTVFANAVVKASDGNDYVGNGIFDVYLGAGRVQQNSSGTKFFIDKGISVIRSPIKYTLNGAQIIKGGCMLTIGNSSALIDSYNAETGECTLSASLGTAAQGVRYRLMSNYLECDPFAYMCRSPHTAELSSTGTKNGLEISGTYSQAQNIGLQSWQISAVYRFADLEKTLVTQKGFTTEIERLLPHLCAGKTDVICTAATQENAVRDFTLSLENSAVNDVKTEVTYTSDSGSVSLIAWLPGDKLDISKTSISVWRADVDENGNYSNLRFVGAENGHGSDAEHGTYYVHIDSSAGLGRKYVYIVSVMFTDDSDETVKCHYGVSEPVRIAAKRYFLSRIERENLPVFGLSEYRRKETYIFDCDIDGGTIETVTANQAVETTAAMPGFTAGGKRYESGTFTAVLGSISSLENNCTMVQNWLDFISGPDIFLLKTDMGDVKIVGITEISRTYGNELSDIGITKISYAWTEILDLDGVIIRV